MEFKFVKQRHENDCGIAVSTMLINYYHNKNFNLEEIKFDNSLNDDMLNFYEIEKLLENYKIEFISYSCSFDELSKLNITTPIVLNVINQENYEHFIIVYKKKKDMMLIADPNKNDLNWVSLKDIEKIYQGYLATSKKFEKIKFKNKKLINWFVFIKNFKIQLILIFLISLISNILILISNNFIKIYIENVHLSNNKEMKYLFLVYLLIFFVQTLISYAINKIIFNIRNKINKEMFLFYKNKLLNLEIDQFNASSKEEWIKKINYITIMSEFITQICLSFPIGLILFITSSIYLLIISPIILSLILIQNAISIMFSILVFYLMKELKIKNERQLIDFSLIYREVLDGFEEIKYKNLQSNIKAKTIKVFNNTIKNTKEIYNLNNKSSVFLSILNKIFFYLIFYISLSYINNEKFTLANLLFYTAISNYINNFFSEVTSFIFNIENINIANKSLFFLFEKKEKKEEFINIDEIKSIDIKNLYKYKSNNCLLKDFSFTFNKNTFVHGKSGSGKTTLLKILTGNFSSYEGQFYINDNEFRDINKNSYCQKIMYLGQYDFLFDGTVWQNIQQFKNKVDLDLLKKFNILEILERNNISLEKKIIDNGANLSKGQRQIINFISLFFTNKQVYLIDEPLSNVDKPTAYYLFKTFMEIKKNSLIIMCDHDLAYVNYFDNRVEVL